MEEAVAIADRDGPFGVEDLLAIHATLMAGQERAGPGRVREEQNWIGGRLGNPSDAVFVPPPEDLVIALLEDLVAFIGREDLPGVPQAAIAHAQFETIHPFFDGNGRVGRALVHVILRRRGIAARFVPPVSIVLAARPAAYVAGLTAFREGRLADWIGSFSEAAGRAAAVSIELADEVVALQADWRQRAGKPRAGLCREPAHRAVAGAAGAVGADGPGRDRRQSAADPRGPQGAGGRGVIRQLSAGTYDRQYAAIELFDLLAAYEERVVGRAR